MNDLNRAVVRRVLGAVVFVWHLSLGNIAILPILFHNLAQPIIGPFFKDLGTDLPARGTGNAFVTIDTYSHFVSFPLF
jgi:hypothetical protein